ncbi:hypothetical protein, partial [Chryseobacterium indologenes]|uniref:hypothetical protein n=1 Tax=Chryseobacterium indologenes TaxID=253 RepID=UPI001E43A37C
VVNIVEREIKFERFRNPILDRTDKQQLISEMEKIAQKISQENTVPFSAFNEIFKNNEIANQLFSLLRFGNVNINRSEVYPIHKKKRRL